MRERDSTKTEPNQDVSPTKRRRTTDGDNDPTLTGASNEDLATEQLVEVGGNDLQARERIAKVVIGADHTAILTTRGRVKCWGRNQYGQLGLGHTRTVGDHPDRAVRNAPWVSFPDHRFAVDIAAGDDHTVAVLDNGDVISWGRNDKGQLGLGHLGSVGDRPERAVATAGRVNLGDGHKAAAVYASRSNTCVRLKSGLMKCFGDNEYGQLGLGHRRTIGSSESDCVANSPVIPVGSGRTVVSAALGAFHLCMLLSDGSVKCSGEAQFDKLGMFRGGYELVGAQNVGDGIGPNLDRVPDLRFDSYGRPIQIVGGTGHTCLLFDTGEVLCFGVNAAGQLGLDQSYDSQPDVDESRGPDWVFAKLGPRDRAQMIFAGGEQTFIVVNSSRLKGWGANRYGQLGITANEHVGDGFGRLPLAEITALDFGPRKIIHAATGLRHTCVALDDDSLACMGRNTEGQLGLGHRNDVSEYPNIVVQWPALAVLAF